MNRTTRTPLIAVSLALAGTAVAPAAPKPNPLVLLWAGSQPDDVTAMSAVRRSLRERGHVDVITYDVENPAVLRASRDTNHPEWVGDALTGTDRAALGKAMGASLVIIVSRGDKSDTAVLEMSSTADASQVTRAQGKIKQDAEAIENLIAHPEQATRTTPAPVPPVTVTPANPVAAAPPITPSPTPTNPVAAAPTPTEPAPTPPAPTNPVAAAPTPAAPAPTNPGTPIAAAPAPANPVAVVPTPTAPATPVAVVPTPATPTPPAPANPVVTAPPVTVATPPVEKPSPKRPLVTLKPKPTAGDTPKLPVGAGDSPDNPITVGDTPNKPITVGGVPNKPVVKGGDTPDSPIVVTSKDPVSPAGGPTVGAVAQDPEALRAVAPMIAKGDQALDRDEVAVAISYYRQAVDGAPLFAEPRLKLAKAYLQGGFEDKAVDEAKRALMIAPDNVSVQEFLIQMDANSTTASGTVAMYEALIAKNPDNLDAHLGLGDAYWNSGALDRAEAEYQKAETLAPKGDVRPASQLVRLYVAQSRYGDAVPVLKQVGPGSYRIAARVMHSRLDTLISTLSSGREAFAAGKSSHEQFYDTSKTVSVQANALADFIDKVQPPAEYKVSHLHLSLAASLIAQEAEVLRTFIETSDPDQQDHAVQLEKSAQSEMLTAHAAEEKSGLFAEKS